MKEKIGKIIIWLVMLVSVAAGFMYMLHPQPQGTLVDKYPEVKQRIILVPLDSRPPCQELVQANGRTAGIEVVVPPHELMDYYTLAGDTAGLRKWLQQELPRCDGAIISIDQLLYGGLLASRERTADKKEIEDLLAFLQQLHQENIGKTIYAFNILPRMQPPAAIEGYQDRKNLLEWSRLQGMLVLGQWPEDGTAADAESLEDTADEEMTKFTDKQQVAEKIRELEADIPKEQLAQYRELYANNGYLNRQLALMAQQGTIKQLVLGQDDGEKYSLPNIEKRKLQEFFQHNHISEKQAVILHGADELALGMLAEMQLSQQKQNMSFYLDYNVPETEDQVMPYMAVSMGETVRERLRFTESQEVSDSQEADAVLFISCGDADNMDRRAEAARKIENYLAQGKMVALVDMSQHFQAQETLFPVLLKSKMPLNGLAAYSGWNTASNSIGTAIAQVQLYHATLANASAEEVPAVVYSNIVNLNNRFCEDYYYLKDVITLVNDRLHKAGYENVYDLDLEHNYQWSLQMLRQAMGQSIGYLGHSQAMEREFTVTAAGRSFVFTVRNLQGDMYFPWPRTFEVNMQTQMELYAK